MEEEQVRDREDYEMFNVAEDLCVCCEMEWREWEFRQNNIRLSFC